MKLTKEERKTKKATDKKQKVFRQKFFTRLKKLEGQEKEKMKKIIKLGNLIKIDWEISWHRYHSQKAPLEDYLRKMVRIHQSEKLFSASSQ